MGIKKYVLMLGAAALLSGVLVLGGCGSEESNPPTTSSKVPRLLPLAESEWNAAQQAVLTPMKAMFKDGRVINIFTTIGRNPNALASWNPFGIYIMAHSTLPARDREIAILRVGWLCQSEYEFGQHTLIAKSVGLTDDEILRITKGPDAPGWSVFESSLIRAVDELHGVANISDANWNSISAQYSEQQMIDLILSVGQYNLVSMALNSIRVPLDPGMPGFP